MRRTVIMVVVLAWLGEARAKQLGKDTLVGWSPDGSWYVIRQGEDSQREDGNTGYYVCASNSPAQASWPTDVRAAVDQDAIGGCHMTDDIGDPEVLQLAAQMVKAKLGSASGPKGLKLSLGWRKKENGELEGVVTFKRGKQALERSFDHYSEKKGRLGKVSWRADGGAAVVEIIAGRKNELHGFGLEELVPPTVPDPARAKAFHLAGVARHAQNDVAAARVSFEQAVRFDPALLAAHFDLAAMASLLGELDLAKRELEFMKASTDPRAKELLTKLATDPNFDRASSHPGLRVLFGLPAWETLDDTRRLTERASRRWSQGGATCAEPTTTLVFEAGGKLSATTKKSCTDDEQSATGSWRTDAKQGVNLDLALPGGKPLKALRASFAKCAGGQHQCLKLGTLGVFQRGIVVHPFQPRP